MKLIKLPKHIHAARHLKREGRKAVTTRPIRVGIKAGLLAIHSVDKSKSSKGKGKK